MDPESMLQAKHRSLARQCPKGPKYSNGFRVPKIRGPGTRIVGLAMVGV